MGRGAESCDWPAQSRARPPLRGRADLRRKGLGEGRLQAPPTAGWAPPLGCGCAVWMLASWGRGLSAARLFSRGQWHLLIPLSQPQTQERRTLGGDSRFRSPSGVLPTWLDWASSRPSAPGKPLQAAAARAELPRRVLHSPRPNTQQLQHPRRKANPAGYLLSDRLDSCSEGCPPPRVTLLVTFRGRPGPLGWLWLWSGSLAAFPHTAS